MDVMPFKDTHTRQTARPGPLKRWATVKAVWPGGVLVSALESRLERLPVKLPAFPLSGNNLRPWFHVQLLHDFLHAIRTLQ